MKLTEVRCPSCFHATLKENPTCVHCGYVRQLTPQEIWEQRWRVLGEEVAKIGRTWPVGTFPPGDDGPSKLIH